MFVFELRSTSVTITSWSAGAVNNEVDSSEYTTPPLETIGFDPYETDEPAG
jgi:hypothetical protein